MKELIEKWHEYVREVNSEYTITTDRFYKPTFWDFMEWLNKNK